MRPRHVPEVPMISALRRGTVMARRPCEEVLRDEMKHLPVFLVSLKRKQNTKHVSTEPKSSSRSPCVNTNIQNLHFGCSLVCDEIQKHLELFPTSFHHSTSQITSLLVMAAGWRVFLFLSLLPSSHWCPRAYTRSLAPALSGWHCANLTWPPSSFATPHQALPPAASHFT